MKKTFCVIGAGTYGCYLANALSEQYSEAIIYLVEVGDKTIRSESEIGYISSLKNNAYKAAVQGRYFGLGGTSAKWGGQLLFFSRNDFADSPAMQAVVEANEKYKTKVLSRFFRKPPPLPEQKLEEDMFVKQGIWLKFQKRNLFHTFRIAEKKNVQIVTGYRVTRILHTDGAITSVVLYNKSETKELKADEYYLTAGALETARLLAVSGVMNLEEMSSGFSDHISLRCFEIMSGSGKVGPVDFRFRFTDGSMLTSRITGEIGDVSYYAHPIFNESFLFFQLLKEIIFKGKFSVAKSISAIKQVTSFFPFLYHYLIRKDLYIYKSWFINLDLELVQSQNRIHLSEQRDAYNEQGIDIDFTITDQTLDKLNIARKKIKEFLVAGGVLFKEVSTTAEATKIEDVYHPYSLFSYKNGETVYDIYHPLSNLFMFNTGLLQRAGAINPTASVFCLIEEHMERISKRHS